MFFGILIICVIAAMVHSTRHPNGFRATRGELLLVYVLVGYCGIPMLAVSAGILFSPGRMAEMLPVGPVTPLVAFFGWAYLGMAVIATMAARVRGSFLLAPALCWAIYFAGATLVHLHEPGGGHGGALIIFASHGLVTALLALGLFWNRSGGGAAGA